MSCDAVTEDVRYRCLKQWLPWLRAHGRSLPGRGAGATEGQSGPPGSLLPLPTPWCSAGSAVRQRGWIYGNHGQPSPSFTPPLITSTASPPPPHCRGKALCFTARELLRHFSFVDIFLCTHALSCWPQRRTRGPSCPRISLLVPFEGWFHQETFSSFSSKSVPLTSLRLRSSILFAVLAFGLVFFKILLFSNRQTNKQKTQALLVTLESSPSPASVGGSGGLMLPLSVSQRCFLFSWLRSQRSFLYMAEN